MKLILSVLVLSAAALAQGPSPFALASYGYTVSDGVVYGAPGQLMIVSVYGISTRIPTPIGGVGQPTSISGISVMLIQPNGPTLPVRLAGLQQTTCPASNVNCPVVTSITIVLPPDMQVPPDGSAGFDTLRIFEGLTGIPTPAPGVGDGIIAVLGVVGDIVLHPITDFVHILNSCDQTLVFLSILGSTPVQGCQPIVQHANGPLVTAANPAKQGETLMLTAYGLGATQAGTGQPFAYQGPVQNFALSYDFRTNAPPLRGSPSVPDYIGSNGAGLYQVNFTVPASTNSSLPPCDGVKVKSNLTVTLSGPLTLDGAQICMKP